MVNHYYDLVTDFYEFGWGRSFHFAPRRKGESFRDSLVRHELFLADRLRLSSEDRVLDLGCGVGGPLMNIARHTGASVTGLNNNPYQLEKAGKYLEENRLDGTCDCLLADFMRIPQPDASYRAAYSIEATAHAPNKTKVFREVCRVLQPGGLFAGFDWCVTGVFDSTNSEHCRIIRNIELGSALPNLATAPEVQRALQEAGFEVLESGDRAVESDPQTPWYRALTGRDLSLSSLPRLPIGRTLTNLCLRVLERLRIVPRGTVTVSSFLSQGADALVAGGETGIFTPMFYFLARKPDE